MIMHKALHPKHNVDCLCQGPKEEEDSPTLKIVFMYQHKESRNTIKKAKKD